MVKRAIKCTPNESPINNEIPSNHRFPFGLSISASQRSPIQNRIAMNKDDIAYTSASTALYQNVSENVKAKLATKEAPKIAFRCVSFNSENPETTLLKSSVSDQNINKIMKARDTTETILTSRAILVTSVANIEKTASII